MKSHVWICFSAVHKCPNDSINWSEIIEKSMLDTPTAIARATIHTVTCTVGPDESSNPGNVSAVNLIPPCRRNAWTPTISRVALFRSHRALKDPELSPISKILRKRFGDKPMFQELKQSWSKCVAPSVLRNLNFRASLNPRCHQKRFQTLLYHLISCNTKFITSPRTSLWWPVTAICSCDSKCCPTSPHWQLSKVFTIDEHLSSTHRRMYLLIAVPIQLLELTKEEIHEVKAQLCPIPTQEPWGIGLNKCSHWYPHKSIDRLLL